MAVERPHGELLTAMRLSPCRYSPDSHPKEWPMCQSGKMKHPECAITALLREPSLLIWLAVIARSEPPE